MVTSQEASPCRFVSALRHHQVAPRQGEDRSDWEVRSADPHGQLSVRIPTGGEPAVRCRHERRRPRGQPDGFHIHARPDVHLGRATAGTIRVVSEQRVPSTGVSAGGSTIDQLARLQGAVETRDPKELAADVWDSDEELDAFLADLRSSRGASLA